MSPRYVRLLAWMLTLCLVFAGPFVAIASPRLFQDDPTPTPAEEASPSPTEEVSPSPTEEVSPSPTEEASPSPTEEASPSPTEEASPSPTEEASPSPTEEASPSPIVSPSPSGSPSPAPGDAQITVTKTADRSEVRVGDLITFTITVENVGDTAVEEVGVVDVLPLCVETVSVNASRADATLEPHPEDDYVLMAVYGPHEAGETVTITVVTRATCTVGPDDSPDNANLVGVFTDLDAEVPQAIADAEITVLEAVGGSPSPSVSPQPGGSPAPSVAPRPSEIPKPSLSPVSGSPDSDGPNNLPETGASTNGTLLLVLVASALIGVGLLTRTMLRQRSLR